MRPGPRVLLLGEVPEQVVAAVIELALTTREVDDLGDLRQSEWDAVVTVAPPALAWLQHGPGRARLRGVADHLYVLALVEGPPRRIGRRPMIPGAFLRSAIPS